MKRNATKVLVLLLLAGIVAVILVSLRTKKENSKVSYTQGLTSAAPTTAQQSPIDPPVPQAPPPGPAPSAQPPVPIDSVIEIKSAASTTAPAKAESSAELRSLESVHFAFRDYRNALGENPVGTNAEITKMLLGNNAKQVKIPVPDGSSVNGNGELCDTLGTPYFFHQVSGTAMEIRSAGQDRQMWTADDLQQ